MGERPNDRRTRKVGGDNPGLTCDDTGSLGGHDSLRKAELLGKKSRSSECSEYRRSNSILNAPPKNSTETIILQPKPIH